MITNVQLKNCIFDRNQSKKMTKQLYILIISSVLFTISCGEETEVNTENKVVNDNITDSLVTEEKKPLALILPENPVLVDNIYATSTALPFHENHLYNCFDNDSTTFWKSPKGATDAEGILISFSKPTKIGSFKLTANEEQTYYYYVNGTLVDQQYGTTKRSQNINKTVKNLFIKFRGKDNIQQEFKLGEEEIQTISKTNPSSYLSLSTIDFFDTKGKAMNIVLPKRVKGNINTPSVLKESPSYAGDNLFDNMTGYAWIEGVEDNGIGSTLSLETEEILSIDALKIWNGYQRSPSHFYANAKLKSFTIKSEELEDSLTLDNSEKPQLTTLSKPTITNKIDLTIKEAYEGNSYQDLGISEMILYSNGYPIKIETDAIENIVKANKANDKLWFLDKGFNNSIEYGDSWSETSLNIRSNGTFVYYKDDHCGAYCYEIIDGNWELVKTTDDKVTITVYGKVFVPTSNEEMYTGKVDMKSVKIFKDEVTITKKAISGKKFLKNIRLQ